MKIKIISKSSKDWHQAVNLVRNKYLRTFNADVLPNPDYFWVSTLPSQRNNDNNDNTQIVACVGMTFGYKKFFSEQYLDESIEQILARLEGKPVSRDRIAEIGSLGAIDYGIGSELLRSAYPIFRSLGKQYILCTATKPLKRILHKLSFHFEPIQISDYRRLGENAKEKWGKYYDKLPETGILTFKGEPKSFGECSYDMTQDCWFCNVSSNQYNSFNQQQVCA